VGSEGHVLVATDADWVFDEVDAALGGPELSVRRVREGRHVLPAIYADRPVLVVLDLQIGNMGGMATCLNIRLEEGVGRLDKVPILMLLDREADVFLARRSAADGWLIKPIDAFTLRRAANALLAGGTYTEGVPEDAGEPSEPLVT
jgi:DNA-binding response OmpR family regulator